MSEIPSYVLGFILAHIELFVGYAICVLFPIPWLNSKIIDLWAKLFKKSSDTPSNDPPSDQTPTA